MRNLEDSDLIEEPSLGMISKTCIYDLGTFLLRSAWGEVSTILNDQLKSSELGDLDYQLAGLLSYVGKPHLPDDLDERFERIRSFDKVLEEARELCKDNDLARAYVAYLDMKRSWVLHHFSGKMRT